MESLSQYEILEFNPESVVPDKINTFNLTCPPEIDDNLYEYALEITTKATIAAAQNAANGHITFICMKKNKLFDGVFRVIFGSQIIENRTTSQHIVMTEGLSNTETFTKKTKILGSATPFLELNSKTSLHGFCDSKDLNDVLPDYIVLGCSIFDTASKSIDVINTFLLKDIIPNSIFDYKLYLSEPIKFDISLGVFDVGKGDLDHGDTLVAFDYEISNGAIGNAVGCDAATLIATVSLELKKTLLYNEPELGVELEEELYSMNEAFIGTSFLTISLNPSMLSVNYILINLRDQTGTNFSLENYDENPNFKVMYNSKMIVNYTTKYELLEHMEKYPAYSEANHHYKNLANYSKYAFIMIPLNIIQDGRENFIQIEYAAPSTAEMGVIVNYQSRFVFNNNLLQNDPFGLSE